MPPYQCQLSLGVEIVEQLFLDHAASKTVYPCSTFILELKQSMESYMSCRLLQGKFVSIKTAVNHCLKELLTEDMVVDETSWTGGGF